MNEEEIEGLYTEEKMSAKNHAGHVSSEWKHNRPESYYFKTADTV